MLWKNLKENKCPSCGKALEKQTSDLFTCSSSRCSFQVTEKRFAEIVNDMYKPKAKCFDSYDSSNEEDLNNFGREIENDSFLDDEELETSDEFETSVKW